MSSLSIGFGRGMCGVPGICIGGETSFVLMALSSVNLRGVTALLQGSGAINLFSQLSEQIIF